MERFEVGSGHVSGNNPFKALAAAARGGIEAQRDLAKMGCQHFNEAGDTQALLDGLCFARLAAAHGDQEDRARLVSMLVLACDASLGDEEGELHSNLWGEAIANICILADGGDDIAEANLSAIVASASADAVVASQKISHMMAAAAPYGERPRGRILHALAG